MMVDTSTTFSGSEYINGLEATALQDEVLKELEHAKTTESRQQLAAQYIGMAFSYSRQQALDKYINREDLFSAALVGLVQAAEDYDPHTYNTRFSTHAHWYIRREVQKEIREQRTSKRLAERLFAEGHYPFAYQTHELTIEAAEIHEKLSEVINHPTIFSDAQRDLLRRVLEDNEPFASIARDLNVSAHTAQRTYDFLITVLRCAYRRLAHQSYDTVRSRSSDS